MRNSRLGVLGRDLVTGVQGIVTARAEYLNGCVRYQISPQSESPNKVNEHVEWVDEQALRVIGQGLRADEEWLRSFEGREEDDAVGVGGPPKAEAPRY